MTSPKKNSVVYISVLFFFVSILISGCKKPPKKQEIPPRPVQTAIVTQKDVPVYIDSFGNFNSLNDVDIKSQVTGQITEVNFQEGDVVSKGQVLFKIDERSYKANLAKAEASVAADKVNLKLKQDTLERNRKLFEQNLISKQDFEKYQTDVAAQEAQLELDKAEVQFQKINLEYCTIVSPIDGITGKRQVDPGNIVPANTGPVLVNIKSIDPLYVDFTIIEEDLNRARASMEKAKLTVEVSVGGEKCSGDLEFLDNAVDNQTGTVSLRAVVSNKDRKLWPGQFVRVKLILGIEKEAMLVPYSAVQLGQKGHYLFAVTNDNKADLRQVETGSRQEDDIVIKKGVQVGENVVTVGQMGLSPGVPVAEKIK